MRITSIERPPRKQRYEVRIDYVLVVPLSPEILAQAGLRTGQEISEAAIKRLEADEARHSALSSAFRLLAYGPRSRREMRDALRRRRIAANVVTETLERLDELRLLDDAEFARSYAERRDRASPRSRRLIAAELRAKGVARAEIESTVGEIDDADAAYRAGARKAHSLRSTDFAEFRRRLGDHLLRRGFSYEIAGETVSRLWAERGANFGRVGDCDAIEQIYRKTSPAFMRAAEFIDTFACPNLR